MKNIKNKTAYILFPILIILIFITINRNKVYRTGESLWHDIFLKNREKPRIVYNYANYLVRNNEMKKGKEVIKNLKDNDYRKYLILSMITYRQKEFEKAAYFAKKSLEYKSNYDGYIMLGEYFFRINRIEELGRVIEKLKDFHYEETRYKVLKAKYYLVKGKAKLALNSLKGAVGEEALFYEGLSYQKLGELEKAKKIYLKVKTIPTAMVNYALIIYTEGEKEKAIKILEKINDSQSRDLLKKIKR
ncbi:tetratricopeptide repeat protein [Haliovirga abyssi]|uniref:Tetratricopeptide repeat protein n=1 Tax=Haliovirga abyssi TaxID=2996794 RepID=A0AAU9DFY1_9FUSO|nr:tetratricopeptide repeat protein [Haliovirga abyssi]BDU51128.1 hypothetical protein HLVA_16970 [Haliovirga abyssi]